MAEHIHSDTKLENNSRVGEKQINPVTKEFEGFNIVNPNGTVLHINLEDYSRTSETSGSANRLRDVIYENYKTLAENVPAATAVFESNAREFPQGVVWKSPKVAGLWNKSAPGKGDDNLDPQTNPIVMVGDLRLPSGSDPIQSGGGITHEHARAQDYLGKDGKWGTQISPEALLHEHVHATRESQNWLSIQAQYEINKKAGINIPVDNLKEVIRLENEAKAIEFVNKTMLSPLGVSERDPHEYRTVKPANISVQPRQGYTEEDKERLRNGIVPEELKQYSQPRVLPVVKNLSESGQIGLDLTSEQKLVALSQFINELPEHQRQSFQKAVAEFANDKGIGIKTLELEQERVA